MSVNVVIPVYNPDGKIDIIIKRLLAQEIMPEKIILVETIDEENDEFSNSRLTNRYENSKVVKVVQILKDEFDHGGTRHMAMEMCNADYVLFMTQDAVPKNKKLISNLVSMLESDDNMAVVCARQEAYKNASAIESYTRLFNYPEENHIYSIDDLEEKGIKTYFISDVCTIYRKELYDEIGGFPVRTILNEDSIYGAKVINMGKLIGYCGDAVVYHSHNYTGVQQFKRNFDIGVSHRQFNYIFKNVKAEGEGLKLVKETANYLMRRKDWFSVLYLLYYSGCKFIGYRLGKLYNKLPDKLVLSCTSNRNYWKKYF